MFILSVLAFFLNLIFPSERRYDSRLMKDAIEEKLQEQLANNVNVFCNVLESSARALDQTLRDGNTLLGGGENGPHDGPGSESERRGGLDQSGLDQSGLDRSGLDQSGYGSASCGEARSEGDGYRSTASAGRRSGVRTHDENGGGNEDDEDPYFTCDVPLVGAVTFPSALRSSVDSLVSITAAHLNMLEIQRDEEVAFVEAATARRGKLASGQGGTGRS